MACFRSPSADNFPHLQLKKKFTGPKEVIQYSLDENWKYRFPQESRADFGESILKEIGKLNLAEEQQGYCLRSLTACNLHVRVQRNNLIVFHLFASKRLTFDYVGVTSPYLSLYTQCACMHIQFHLQCP